MPSGPRKRRAARRKKRMENAATPLPSDPPKDGKQHEDLMLHESRESETESSSYSSAPSSPFIESRPPGSLNQWVGSEAVDCAAESSKNDLKAADLVQQDEQDVAFAVTEAALLPTDASDTKSELFAQSEKEYRKSFEESAISIEKIVSLPEERSQVTEVPIPVNEVALLPTNAPEAKSDKFVESEKEDKKPSEKSAISVKDITPLPEESSQISEVAVNVLEKASGDQRLKGVQPHDANGIIKQDDKKPSEKLAISDKDITALPEESSQISEVAANVLEKVSGDQRLKGAQPHDANGIVKQDGETNEACQVARGEKTLPVAEALHHAPLVVHHTKWWNCCGLLDLIRGRDI